MKECKMIYSDYLGTMIPAGFTTKKVLFDRRGNEGYKICKSFHYTWNEEDLLYYRDDVDDEAYDEIPSNGFKIYTLKLGKRARVLIKLD